MADDPFPGSEPSLQELLDDPIVEFIFRRDRITRDVVEQVVAEARLRRLLPAEPLRGAA